MQRIKHMLCGAAVAMVCGACAPQTIVPGTLSPQAPLTPQWTKRIAATADNPQKARKVILDGIYANKTTLVAAAYEKLYNAKPSDVRLGTFGYAAAVSERFQEMGGSPYLPAFKHAVSLLQHACAPETEENASHNRLKRTRDANAWLAWGSIRVRTVPDILGGEKAYRKALQLEPDLAEAHWWLADIVTIPNEIYYFKSHAAEARNHLDRADTLEPALHPLIVWDRAYLYFGNGAIDPDLAGAKTQLEEFVRLWPANPHVAEMRHLIAITEKELAAKKRP